MKNQNSSKKRLLSGIQPTGKMHLGNYLGAVSNWVKLQEEYDSFFFVADLHSLTTVYENPEKLRQDKWELVVDLLSTGLDPEKCCLFIQSELAEHSELHLMLSMITPLPWLMRVPSYKGKMEEIKDKDLNTYGFLGYPVLMASDILLYKAEVVPVGKDQMAHLELTREICRRFNNFYGNVFIEPKEKLTEVPILPGLDGRKMSKSYGNTIPLDVSEEELNKLIRSMLTDPQRKLRTDPGDPEVCPVFQYHKIYSEESALQEITAGCRSAGIGCVDCKKRLAQKMNGALDPIRKKRSELLQSPDTIKDILVAGNKRAQEVAGATMAEVRKALGL